MRYHSSGDCKLSWGGTVFNSMFIQHLAPSPTGDAVFCYELQIMHSTCLGCPGPKRPLGLGRGQGCVSVAGRVPDHWLLQWCGVSSVLVSPAHYLWHVVGEVSAVLPGCGMNEGLEQILLWTLSHKWFPVNAEAWI